MNQGDRLIRWIANLAAFLEGSGAAAMPRCRRSYKPYAVDVHEDRDHFYVEAELPGFTEDDVEITLEDGVLTLRGRGGRRRRRRRRSGGSG